MLKDADVSLTLYGVITFRNIVLSLSRISILYHAVYVNFHSIGSKKVYFTFLLPPHVLP